MMINSIGGFMFAALAAGFTVFSVTVDPIAPVSTSSVTPLPTPAATHKTATKNSHGPYDLVEFDGQKITRTNSEWKRLLTADQYYVLRRSGTERAFTGALTDNKEIGVYYCAACGLALFRSTAKYDSGTGWPSFFEPAFAKNLTEKLDLSLPDEPRKEVICSRCGGHLGHVFEDGPEPTGLRYCINSAALKFKKE